MNYQTAYKIVNDFMIGSGIRDFCGNRCGSVCCNGCPDKKDDGCCEERLTCTIYLCSALVDIIFTAAEKKLYYCIQEAIINKAVKHRGRGPLNLTQPGRIYSLPPQNGLYKEEFPEIISRLKEFNIKNIHTKLNQRSNNECNN